MSKRIETACVLGAGSAGLITAVTLRRLLPSLQVRVVYSPDAPVIGVGESTTAYLPKFLHDILGLDRSEFFYRVEPTWKLGIRFQWGPPGDSHFNYGFENLMTFETKALRKPAAFYCAHDPRDAGPFSALMDRDLAPCLPTPEGLHLQHGSAYHIDNSKFLAYMRDKAEQFGVEFTTGKVVEAEQADTGHITNLILADGRTLAADLFFDCSGFRSMLLSKYFDQPYVSYADALFCDRALVGDWQRDDTVQPYTLAETMPSGWCWRIDFMDHVNRGYVFCSEFCDEDQAADEMRTRNPQLGEDLELIKFPSGRLENYWVKNAVAIGNSAAFVEPLESSALHMAAETATVVCGVLRDADMRIIPQVLPAINGIYRRKWDDIRDFLAVHYRFNQRLDSPFWRHCRQETELGNAKPLIEMYRVAGPTRTCSEFIAPESIFQLEGYLTQLIGQRVPTDFSAELSEDDRQSWARWQEGIRRSIAGAIPVREAVNIIRSQGVEWKSSSAAGA
ncbi:MAG: tryptophan halogenase family protein [Pirellulales bacterium]